MRVQVQPRRKGGVGVSWGEEWGDERRRRRPRDPDAEFRKKEEERAVRAEPGGRDSDRERHADEHYWARPREVGQDRYRALAPSRPPGVRAIEDAAVAARRRLGPAPPGILMCGPCRSDHHGNCLRAFHMDDGGEEILCECSADAHWFLQGVRR